MNLHLTPSSPLASDAELVALSTAGDREAFGRIVTRYQALVSSIAYNATGNLAHSEDLAQETFIAAWKQLRHLREPAKLRSWLCGIARNLVHNSRRRLRHEPAHTGESLEAVAETAGLEPLPSDQAISHEQEAILWRSLERIPELYREPLILFYREHKSVERVATDLELSEDAVKQRLSRGRKLLHEQVLAFVEGALARTAPGETFTAGVIGALPLMAASSFVAATGVGSTAAKSGAAALGAKLATLAATVVGPLLGVLGAWVGMRASLDATRTPRERAVVVRMMKVIGSGALLFAVLMAAFTVGARAYSEVSPVTLAGIGVACAVVYLVWVAGAAFYYKRRLDRLRVEEKQRHPEAFRDAPVGPYGAFREFRSRATFLGLPLVHVRLSTPPGERTRPAVGWIAIGDYAIGVLFGLGGVSVGAVSIGGISFGLFAIGGFSLALIALGGLAMGGIAIGGAAVGYVATGGIAFAWHAAEGGFAAAREIALGAHAAAAHANDAIAKEFFAARPWLDFRSTFGKLVLTLLWLPSLLVILQYRRIRALRRRR